LTLTLQPSNAVSFSDSFRPHHDNRLDSLNKQGKALGIRCAQSQRRSSTLPKRCPDSSRDSTHRNCWRGPMLPGRVEVKDLTDGYCRDNLFLAVGISNHGGEV